MRFYQLHRIVDHFAEAVEAVSLCVLDIRRYDFFGKIDEIIILRFFGKKERGFLGEVARFYREHFATAHGAVFEDLRLDQLETAVRIAQKDQPKHGHAVLIRRQLGIRTQQIRRLPQLGFQLFDAFIIHGLITFLL